MARITPALPPNETLEPTRILDIDVCEPVPDLLWAGEGRNYRRALVLLRVHRIPVALVALDLPDGGLDSDAVAARLWAGASGEIAAHLRDDGLAPPARLDAAGLGAPAEPACAAARRKFLETAPAISVVVATRERVEHLARCLQALFAMDYPRFEIVVVDNAPATDATKALVEALRAEGKPVRYVREDVPGLAAAHACGLREVETGLVALTDDDVIVDRDWLTAMAEAFASREGVGCVTGLILPTELETPAQIWLERRARLNKGFERIVFRRDDGPDSDPLFPYTAGRFGSGASMAFDTDLLRRTGGFDAASGVGTPARGGDDLIAFFRVVAAGYALVYEPRSVLWHAYRGELARLERQMFDYGAGLTAYLTSVVVANPRLALDIVPRLPRAARYALSGKSPRNPGSTAPFERRVVWAERLGMGYGPVGYALSRRRLRKLEPV